MPPNASSAAPPRLFGRWWFYGLLSFGILAADYLTGPFLQFPILFVVPVTLAAWYRGPRDALLLAVLLPLGRLGIALTQDVAGPWYFAVANAATRMVVLGLLAYLVARTARQTRELKAQVTGLARVCAWSRTVEYQGEWLSFEEYLKRRFHVETTHGIAPDEARKLAEALRAATPETGGSGRN
jgi:hypothetical protein